MNSLRPVESDIHPPNNATRLPLSADELRKIDAYWRAANYLSVDQIYLYGNPLLREPLKFEHIKPRLLDHWGTTPGLNFIYTHVNRVIGLFDLDMIFITGPGHGGPTLVANTYLEGTYSELYPQWFYAPGSRLYRCDRQQESGCGSCLSAARRQRSALRDRSLSAQPRLRQRDHRRKAARAAVA